MSNLKNLKDIKDYPIEGKYLYFLKTIEELELKLSIKAANLVINEMNKTKGFVRHGGADYFIHPIEVAQEVLNFGLHDDEIIASALLHDTIEDIDYITYEYIQQEFSNEIAIIVDNVTKRDSERKEDYIKRVSSNPKSAIIKTLDRVNNVSTMSQSSLKHRYKQVKETREVYIPLIKSYRKEYSEYSEIFHYARMLIDRFLDEIERSIALEEEINRINKIKKDY